MSFFEELTKKATGLATGILGDIKGTNDDGSASANLQSMFQINTKYEKSTHS